MVIRNEDVRELLIQAPEGHAHLRTTMTLQDGTELTFQEATIANLVRAYVSLKTHPKIRSLRLKQVYLEDRKEGFAEWQLLESGG